MTKEEKAVLAACNKRFDAFLAEGGYGTTDAAVIKSQKQFTGPKADLIRAVAKWRKATGKSKA